MSLPLTCLRATRKTAGTALLHFLTSIHIDLPQSYDICNSITCHVMRKSSQCFNVTGCFFRHPIFFSRQHCLFVWPKQKYLISLCLITNTVPADILRKYYQSHTFSWLFLIAHVGMISETLYFY